jgi:hypothetical protein
MRRSLVKFNEPEASNHTPSLADFITTMSGFKFSVHTRLASGQFRGKGRSTACRTSALPVTRRSARSNVVSGAPISMPVIGYADMEARRGNGCSSIWISERELRRLGPRTPEGIPTDRLQGLMVLQGSDQACVTVFRNRRTKAYRRNTGRRS